MGKTRTSCGEVFPGVPEEDQEPGKKKRFEEMKELLLKNLKDTEEKHNLELKFENARSLLESEVRARERAEAERDKLRGQLTLLKELILNDQSLEIKEDAATMNADVTAPTVTQKRPATRNSDETEDMNVNDSQDAEPSHKKMKFEERKEQLLNNLKQSQDNECLEKQLPIQMDIIETFSKQKNVIRKMQEKIHREYGRKVKSYANHARIWRGEKLIKFTEDKIKELERVKEKLQRNDDVNCEEEMKKQIQSQKKLIEELENNLNIFMKAENKEKRPTEEEEIEEDILKHNKVNSTDEPFDPEAKILNELEKQIQFNKTFIQVLQNNVDNLKEEGIKATGLIQASSGEDSSDESSGTEASEAEASEADLATDKKKKNLLKKETNSDIKADKKTMKSVEKETTSDTTTGKEGMEQQPLNNLKHNKDNRSFEKNLPNLMERERRMKEQCKVLQNLQEYNDEKIGDELRKRIKKTKKRSRILSKKLEEMNNVDSTVEPQEPKAIILVEEEMEEVIRVQKILIEDLVKFKNFNNSSRGEDRDKKKDNKAREKETGSDTRAEKETRPTEANNPLTKPTKKGEKARENKIGSDRIANADQTVSNDNKHIKSENKSKVGSGGSCNKLDIKSFLKIIK